MSTPEAPHMQAGCLGGIFKTRFRRSSNLKGHNTPLVTSDNPAPSALRRDELAHRSSASPGPSGVSGEHKPNIYYGTCCDFSGKDYTTNWPIWEDPPPYSNTGSSGIFRAEVMRTIEYVLDQLDPTLRKLSLQIHDNPEIMFQEKFAHDTLSQFMESHGFSVTRHYLGMDTAWRAEFAHGKGGRVLGVNSEMDALPMIGHACGHNLIAISGVGVAIAVKAALETHNVPGKVVLLGTPAEEGGGGKVILLERGGYTDMDVCVMCHPAPGIAHSAGISTSLAMQAMEVEFFGQSAHAAAAPWEGTNALDAAFLAYSSIAVLRQQIKPDHRVHGVIKGHNGAANVIPDYAKMRWYVRAPTREQLFSLRDRVQACFKAAAMATSCRANIEFGLPYLELRQNSVLGAEFIRTANNHCGIVSEVWEFASAASTDFGNVTYELPSIHPIFAIPTQPHGGNHSPAFAESARSTEAHKACMAISKGLALTGFRVINDDDFFRKVRDAFELSKTDKTH
ncbi:hypothetical protein SERLA73DRAFT_184799 [Serpula lacrymans var. lacrymans S7.3]|uniref:Peptidase M20 dimerisation domain-containing protein n=2 Tax=Serpula lacrymans var. lacrymans TaxID=341189 RepID=F8Q546_SERL3|nr:uncharacterized protein SERLADRAFT_472924 [Serpula lacrymans var. lacrymans S7.9]EGN96673.1 hypothetical protein SERLA73DRAFT_184799 [Serpula lacrymans var. lacrymans S7.3]EGO22291.1 hypothetical protein SERLADRAFT_472924 [Serpula lacrymans var. lacrymans S7.9]